MFYRHVIILNFLLQSSLLTASIPSYHIHIMHLTNVCVRYTTYSFHTLLGLVFYSSITLLPVFYLIIYTVTIDGCLDGDLVQDTPAENEPYYGCDPNNVPDTCPSQPGLDPIHNYMDYSDDVCLTGR